MIDEKVLIERLTDAGGCDAKEDYFKGWDDAIGESIEIVNQLAEEQKQCIKSSCSNCETYDNEKHYCPTWCDVIENTVKELAEESNLTPCYLGSTCEYQNEDAEMPVEILSIPDFKELAIKWNNENSKKVPYSFIDWVIERFW